MRGNTLALVEVALRPISRMNVRAVCELRLDGRATGEAIPMVLLLV